MENYQVAVLGGGPGGYEAAIRCAQFGMKTVLIEARELGGTCLNRGCIPTKALLHCAEVYHQARNTATFGVSIGEPSYDYAKMAAYKDKVVARLRDGIAVLEKAYGVSVVQGFGILTDAHKIKVNDQSIQADSIILATGSAPAKLPIPGFKHALNSDDVLGMTELPEELVIVGGGVIGMEFASLFSMLGKKVTVLEMMPQILPGVDEDIVKILMRTLKKDGVSIMTSAKVLGIQKNSRISVSYEAGGKTQNVKADCCIVSTGRFPMTAGIGLEKLGVRTDRGFVAADDHMRTSIPNIYAIGDITGKVQLAHVATAQGMTAAANCAGGDQVMCYDIIPSCIYTATEIASVGLTQETAVKQGLRFKTGAFQLLGNGKSMVMGVSDGLAKLVVDEETDAILGAHIMAPRATDMIAEICAVMECEGTLHELEHTIHPHPTVSEILMEAAHDVNGMSCNAMPRK